LIAVEFDVLGSAKWISDAFDGQLSLRVIPLITNSAIPWKKATLTVQSPSGSSVSRCIAIVGEDIVPTSPIEI
jgi:hypothetical protein